MNLNQKPYIMAGTSSMKILESGINFAFTTKLA